MAALREKAVANKKPGLGGHGLMNRTAPAGDKRERKKDIKLFQEELDVDAAVKSKKKLGPREIRAAYSQPTHEFRLNLYERAG